jgi:hypothetical protein
MVWNSDLKLTVDDDNFDVEVNRVLSEMNMELGDNAAPEDVRQIHVMSEPLELDADCSFSSSRSGNHKLFNTASETVGESPSVMCYVETEIRELMVAPTDCQRLRWESPSTNYSGAKMALSRNESK